LAIGIYAIKPGMTCEQSKEMLIGLGQRCHAVVSIPTSISLHGMFWGHDRLEPKLPAKKSEIIDGQGHKATRWNI